MLTIKQFFSLLRHAEIGNTAVLHNLVHREEVVKKPPLTKQPRGISYASSTLTQRGSCHHTVFIGFAEIYALQVIVR